MESLDLPNVAGSDGGPEYYPLAFPREMFPQILWTEKPPALPESVWTTETTHRDGQQGGLPLTAAQGVELFRMMNAFSGRSGAIRQAEFFVYRDADREMLREAVALHRSGAPIEPTTWIRASVKDVELVRSLGIAETGMLASVSDYHTFHKFNPPGRAAASSAYLRALETALASGIRPRLHLEDATRAPRDFLLGFVDAVKSVASRHDPALRPKFRICDTMGLGLPFHHVEWPRSIPKMVADIRALGVRSEDLEFHPHNDLHLVVVNSLAAVMAGVSVINGTLLAKGERTGNAPLEGVILHLAGMGYFGENQPDYRKLNELVAYYDRIGQPVPAKYPLFGRDAHRTRAGIHADGLNKFWWMYAPFDVPKLLGRPLEVTITKESGMAGLVFMIRQHTGSTLSKEDPALVRLYDWVTSQFDSGRQTSIEWEEVRERLTALPVSPR